MSSEGVNFRPMGGNWAKCLTQKLHLIGYFKCFLKCMAKVFFSIRLFMSSEIPKCSARDPWYAGQNVRRSSKTFHALYTVPCVLNLHVWHLVKIHEPVNMTVKQQTLGLSILLLLQIIWLINCQEGIPTTFITLYKMLRMRRIDILGLPFYIHCTPNFCTPLSKKNIGAEQIVYQKC